ncbi:MAG: hypothetical protein KGJ64_03315, partial [Betaproteobacteria bacterium]|nr:hypothetical protein [Betaproteobacteria bacterium]
MQREQQLPGGALSVSGAALVAAGGAQAWSALALLGDEAVDTLFDYELLLRRHGATPTALPGDMLGRGLDVRIELGVPGGAARPPRLIHGEVSQVLRVRDDERGSVYALRLRPWAWRATLRGGCRVWRGLSVPQVLEQLLRPPAGSLVARLRGRHAPRDYLVQFNESDWDCFARLAAEWGMHFWFEHRQGGHDLVLADDNAAWREQPASGWSSIGMAVPGERDEHECLRSLRHGHALCSMGWSGRDDDYTLREGLSSFEAADLGETCVAPGTPASRTRFHWRGSGGVAVAQPRQATGGAALSTAAVGRADADERAAAEQALAQARLQALRQTVGRAHGHGPLRGLATGHRVRLRSHRLAALSTDWLVVGTRLELRESAAACAAWFAASPAACIGAAQDVRHPAEPPPDQPVEPAWGDAGRAWRLARAPGAPGVEQGAWRLRTEVVLQRASQPMRAQRSLPKPRVWGLQAAVVAEAEPGAALPGSV